MSESLKNGVYQSLKGSQVIVFGSDVQMEVVDADLDKACEKCTPVIDGLEIRLYCARGGCKQVCRLHKVSEIQTQNKESHYFEVN